VLDGLGRGARKDKAHPALFYLPGEGPKSDGEWIVRYAVAAGLEPNFARLSLAIQTWWTQLITNLAALPMNERARGGGQDCRADLALRDLKIKRLIARISTPELQPDSNHDQRPTFVCLGNICRPSCEGSSFIYSVKRTQRGLSCRSAENCAACRE